MPKQSKKSSTSQEPSGDRSEADKWMYSMVASNGLDVEWMDKPTAFGLMRRLVKLGQSPQQVAKEMGLKRFQIVGPSKGQIGYMDALGLPWQRCRSKKQAGWMLDAHLEPLKCYKRLLKEIDKAGTPEELDAVGRLFGMVKDVLPADYVAPLVAAGKERRESLKEGIPE